MARSQQQRGYTIDYHDFLSLHESSDRSNRSTLQETLDYNNQVNIMNLVSGGPRRGSAESYYDDVDIWQDDDDILLFNSNAAANIHTTSYHATKTTAATTPTTTATEHNASTPVDVSSRQREEDEKVCNNRMAATSTTIIHEDGDTDDEDSDEASDDGSNDASENDSEEEEDNSTSSINFSDDFTSEDPKGENGNNDAPNSPCVVATIAGSAFIIGNGNQEDSHADEKHSQSTSFFADTPYFNAYMTKEFENLQIVSDSLHTICDETKAFAAAGVAMAYATKRLALACKLQQKDKGIQLTSSASSSSGKNSKRTNNKHNREHERKKQALGVHLSTAFEHVGEMLTTIASVQEHMCNVIETKLSYQMEDLLANPMDDYQSIQEDVKKQTEYSEQLFWEYLNGKQAGGNLVVSNTNKDVATVPHTEERRATIAREWTEKIANVHMEQGISEFKRIQLYKHNIDMKYKWTTVVSNSMTELCKELSGYYSLCERVTKSETHIIKKYFKKNVNSNPLFTNDILLKEKDKSTILNILANTNTNNGNNNNNNNNTIGSGNTFDSQKQNKEEERIEDDIQPLSSDNSCNSKKTIDTNDDSKVIDTVKGRVLLENIESDVGIWDITTSVAKALPYRREAPKGVLMEGWLYEQIPVEQHESKSKFQQKQQPEERRSLFAILKSLSSPEITSPTYFWKKKWCMLKNDGIYCMEQDKQHENSNQGEDDGSSSPFELFNENDELSHYNGLSIKKLCDVDDCFIRKLPYDPSQRFCFKLMLQNQTNHQEQQNDHQLRSSISQRGTSRYRTKKDNVIDNTRESISRSFTFQAQGPDELGMWIHAIRSLSGRA